MLFSCSLEKEERQYLAIKTVVSDVSEVGIGRGMAVQRVYYDFSFAGCRYKGEYLLKKDIQHTTSFMERGDSIKVVFEKESPEKNSISHRKFENFSYFTEI